MVKIKKQMPVLLPVHAASYNTGMRRCAFFQNLSNALYVNFLNRANFGSMNIVITGASRGIGFAIAEKFAEAGPQNSLFLSSQNESRIRAAAEVLTERFPPNRIEWIAADLSEGKGVQKLKTWLQGKKVVADVLVNNAGYFIPGSIHNEENGTLEKMLNVNLLSAYNLTRALLPGMMERKSGHIFNMCSIASFAAYKNGGSYSISKFALLGFGKNLRQEMMPYHIKVTNILPGAVYTDSWAESGMLAERLMEAKDVASLVFAAAQLSPRACPEEIIIRPILGDL